MAEDFNTDYPPSPYLGPNDQAGYDQSGWYPGKKRNWWEPVLKVASWNAWSPDDEKATRLNERIAAGRAGTGVELDLDLIPRRARGLTPYEILLSESQERMVMVARPGGSLSP